MKKPSKKESSSPVIRTASLTTSKEHILVQDDEEAIREIMASMLRSEGYECQTAETAAETFDILNAQRVDLIICGYFEWSEKDFKLMTTAFPDVPVIICMRHAIAAW